MLIKRLSSLQACKTSMPMPMMHVGHMRMRVRQSGMPMRMHVGFAGRILRSMGMLMMFIMRMSVRVSYRLMLMDVLVVLRNVKPHAEAHQCAGNKQRQGNWVAERKNCRGRAKKGGG